ncbi:N-acyl-D-amino-acid deacylase family protein [Sorangium sp. KYC3313]|uniref:N-acyl-D-amino-acid deacylase family protein n=1 Tax=Sorangium sp. KYC3313 TaxID=3449740 RepID=UPI003F8A5587
MTSLRPPCYIGEALSYVRTFVIVPERKGGALPDFDIVIKGGKIVDGTQVPAYLGDIGIRDGRIAEIGRIAEHRAAQVLDASGLIVAPGFIDLHTHYDAQIQWDPYCTISGWHGVTSVVLGNCGFGFAPVRPEERERAMLSMTRTEAIPFESMKKGMLWDWVTFPEWLDSLERMPKGVNCKTYVPVSPLMIWVMGLEAAKSRDATEAETREMQRLLNEAMDHGACGFSVQRLGESSIQADYDGTPMATDTMSDRLVLALADVLRQRGDGIIQITQSLRDIGPEVFGTEWETNPDWDFESELAAACGRPVLHNLIIPLDIRQEIHQKSIRWVEKSNTRGERIFGQTLTGRAPYTFTLEDWNLYDTGPAWNKALLGTAEDKMRNIADPEMRRQLVEDSDEKRLATAILGGPIADLLIVDVAGRAEFDRYLGRSVGDLARETGKHPVEALLDLSLATRLKAAFQTGNGNSNSPDVIAQAMESPYTLPGVSDGGAHTKFLTGGSYSTDFLTWLVRDTGKISLEKAHYKLSFLPAHAAGFRDRGYLREGAAADIIVYDLPNLRRTPEWGGDVVYDIPGGEWRRVQRSEGYRWVLVNGQVTFEDGKCTGATPGRLLRHGRSTG